MIHFTSDQHFFHKNILKFQCNRRRRWATIEDMNSGLIELHNSVVKPDDLVYMLGDFAFANIKLIEELLVTLNGTKVLVLGNHDKGLRKASKNLVKMGYLREVYNGYHEITINKKLIVLNHYSQRVWNKSHWGSFHLFGHSHGSLDGCGKSVDVGVDSKEMAGFLGEELRPWSQDEIFEFMKTKDRAYLDYHNENTT